MDIERLIKLSASLMVELMDTRDLKSDEPVEVLRQMVLVLLENSMRKAYELGLDKASEPG